MDLQSNNLKKFNNGVYWADTVMNEATTKKIISYNINKIHRKMGHAGKLVIRHTTNTLGFMIFLREISIEMICVRSVLPYID